MAEIPPMTRTHSEVERRIHAALEEARTKQRPPTKYVYLSSIGKCPRELWALRNGIPDERPPGGQALMTFDVGRDLEHTVVGWLRAAGYEVLTADAQAGEQYRVEMADGIGRGKIDGMILWGRPSLNDWRLVEIKTAKAKQFDLLVEAGGYDAWKPAYGDQIHAYMGSSQETLGIPGLSETLVLVVCKDDARLWSEMIAFDSDRYAQLVARARLALGDEMPERPKQANGQYSKFCKWCSVAAWCYSPVVGIEFDE